jgi:hypothetical protein
MDSVIRRLDFIESIAKSKIPEFLLDKFIKEIKPDIRNRARERNRVVHGHWTTSQEYPEDLILLSSGEAFRYTVKDFEDIALRINKTNLVAAAYWRQVKEYLRPAPVIQPDGPPLPIVVSHLTQS